MSEKVSIQESGKSRSFSGVGVIETETPEGDSCFWVPESERELETEYVIKNGTYRPQKYGFSDIHVNVFDLTTDLDGNDWKIDIGDIDIPDISMPDFDIDLTIDPSTGLPGISIDGVAIDLPDLSETIDLDAGFDVSLDVDDASSLDDIGIDISGSDLDGLPIDVNIDLGTLDIETTDLPDEIRIMHVPDKTSYKDGEAIDLEGLVVQAYRGGEVWEDKDGKYIDGYIPVHELSYKVTKSENEYTVIDGVPCSNHIEYIYKGTLRGVPTVFHEFQNFTTEEIKERYSDYSVLVMNHYDSLTVANINGIIVNVISSSESDLGGITPNVLKLREGETKPYGDNIFNPSGFNVTLYKNGTPIGYVTRNNSHSWGWGIVTVPVSNTSPPQAEKNYSEDLWNDLRKMGYGYTATYGGALSSFLAYAAYLLLTGKKEGKIGESFVEISWPRPHDSQLLTASFNITVEENDGAAQSNEESSGGTTISGNYGGSHHSGTF